MSGGPLLYSPAFCLFGMNLMSSGRTPSSCVVVKHKGGHLMGYFSKFLGISAALMLLSVSAYAAEERDPLKARVPADQMADARAMKNPIAVTPENIAKGKALFEGKGKIGRASCRERV